MGLIASRFYSSLLPPLLSYRSAMGPLVQHRLFCIDHPDPWKRRLFKCVRMLRLHYCGPHEALPESAYDAKCAVYASLLSSSWSERHEAFAVLTGLLPDGPTPLFWADSFAPPPSDARFSGLLCIAITRVSALSPNDKLLFRADLAWDASAAASAASVDHLDHWAHFLLGAKQLPVASPADPSVEIQQNVQLWDDYLHHHFGASRKVPSPCQVPPHGLGVV